MAASSPTLSDEASCEHASSEGARAARGAGRQTSVAVEQQQQRRGAGRQTGVSELLQWSSSSSSEEARGPVAEPR